MTESQHQRLIALIERAPFGDLEPALIGVEYVLGLAMEATAEAFVLWEEHARERGYLDEFSLTGGDLAAMDADWKLAFIARLLRTAALDLGLPTEFNNNSNGRRSQRGTLASLLIALCEIARPTTQPHESDDETSRLADTEGESLRKE
jgi:hypothetical protein